MADQTDPAFDEDDALARLEAALDRIASLAKPNPQPPTDAAATDAAAADTAAIAARLDTLIAQIRSALAIAEA